jgi:hypothetical protein
LKIRIERKKYVKQKNIESFITIYCCNKSHNLTVVEIKLGTRIIGIITSGANSKLIHTNKVWSSASSQEVL